MAPSIYSQLLIAVAVTLALASMGDAHGNDDYYGVLNLNYYSETCPQARRTISSLIRSQTKKNKILPAALLRLHFHDCFVRGCDASVLLDSTSNNVAEKDAVPNLSLRGFEVIDEVKDAVEKLCPGVVSCADILSLAARESISFNGGPRWRVPLGRRDGVASIGEEANASLPSPNMNFDTLVQNFAAVGLSKRDMVVLSGAHTIGETRCAEVMPRLYNFPGSADGVDPSLDRRYAEKLKKKCPSGAELTRIRMDPSNGGEKFDNYYYRNIVNKKGIFQSDDVLGQDKGGRDIVRQEIKSQAKFFRDFGQSMEKMGRISVLTGSDGEIRLKCSAVN